MDKDLAARLGVASATALSRFLESIHEQIMETDGPNKMKATVEYVFSIDDDGLLAVDVTAKVPLKSASRTIRLKSSGGQLRLWDIKPERFPKSVEDMTPSERREIERQISKS